MLAAVPARRGRDPVHNRAGSNMSWGWPPRCSSKRGSEGLFEVDEAWLPRMVDELDPAPDRARQPVPRPARPLRRARAPRRRVGGAGRRAAPAAAGSCSTPTTPWSPTSAATASCAAARGCHLLRDRGPAQALPELQHAHDAKHCRRCGSPYTYERAFVGHLGHYECPSCGADRPAPDVAATAIELLGMAARGPGQHARGRARARAAAPRPLQRLQRARGHRRRPAARVGARARRRRAERGRGGLRPGGDDPGRRRKPGLDPADQEPRRRERGPADARRLEARRARRRRARPLDRAQRPDRRRPRRLLDLGRRLRAARRRRAGRLRGHPAPEMALRLKYAGSRPGVDRGRAVDRALARPRRRRARTAGCSRLPTYTALLELRTPARRARAGPEFWR